MSDGSGAATSLAVCIDDFGMHDGVNQAALELGLAGRASAVGCMVNGPAWQDGADALQSTLRGKVHIGLHLDLTESWPHRRQRSLGQLIASAYVGALSHQRMGDEVRRQLDAFEDAMAMAPDFVDGHQHVHQLPTIREVLVDELSRRYAGRLPWIRYCGAPPDRGGQALGDGFKARMIGLLGSGATRRLARRRGFQQNARLLGVYGFDATAAQYLQRAGRWLAEARDRDLLMCHPATHGNDALSLARRIEYDFYRGQEFASLLQQYRIAVECLHPAGG